MRQNLPRSREVQVGCAGGDPRAPTAAPQRTRQRLGRQPLHVHMHPDCTCAHAHTYKQTTCIGNHTRGPINELSCSPRLLLLFLLINTWEVPDCAGIGPDASEGREAVTTQHSCQAHACLGHRVTHTACRPGPAVPRLLCNRLGPQVKGRGRRMEDGSGPCRAAASADSNPSKGPDSPRQSLWARSRGNRHWQRPGPGLHVNPGLQISRRAHIPPCPTTAAAGSVRATCPGGGKPGPVGWQCWCSPAPLGRGCTPPMLRAPASPSRGRPLPGAAQRVEAQNVLLQHWPQGHRAAGPEPGGTPAQPDWIQGRLSEGGGGTADASISPGSAFGACWVL